MLSNCASWLTPMAIGRGETHIVAVGFRRNGCTWRRVWYAAWNFAWIQCSGGYAEKAPATPGASGSRWVATGQPMTAETQYVNARVAATAPATLLASQGNAYTPGGVSPPGVLGALSQGIIGYMIRWQLDTLPCGCALHGHPSNALGCLTAIRRSSGGQVKCNGPPLGRAVHPGLYAGSLQPAVFKGPV